MKRTPIKRLLESAAASERVLVKGWVRTRRDSKGFSFLELNDGSCLKNLQVIVDEGLSSFAQLKDVTTGAALEVEGALVESPGQGQTWEVRRRGPAAARRRPTPRPTPCRRSATRSSSCATIAHLRPRTNTFGAVVRVRSPRAPSPSTSSSRSAAFSTCTRRSSPPATAKGAGEMFQVTTLDLRARRAPKATGSISRRTSSARPADLTVSRPARGGDLRLRAGQRLHLRPHLPRRELQHPAPPGRVLDDRAGDGLLRPRRTTWTWPRSSSSTSSATSWSAAARTWSSSTSASTRR